MTSRESAIVGLRDTLEHLTECQKQLEWADDFSATSLLTDAMVRDLERCRRLLEMIRRREPVRHPA